MKEPYSIFGLMNLQNIEPYFIFRLTNLRTNEPLDYCIKSLDKRTLFQFRINEPSGIGKLCVRTNEPSEQRAARNINSYVFHTLRGMCECT